MAICIHCRQRKGKRACPALAGSICPSCCGEHRQVTIACPPDCVHLEPHGEYQRRRTMDRVPPGWIHRIMGYERRDPPTQEIVHETQVALCLFAQQRSMSRGEARDGLEFARQRMSPIETPVAYVPPFGEFLVERLDALIQGRERVERDGVRTVLQETLDHLDAEVPEESFAEFMAFLRALYGEHLAAQGSRESSGLILP